MAKSEAWGDMYKDHQNDQVKRGAVIEKRALEADCGQSSQEGKYESAWEAGVREDRKGCQK